MGTSPPQKDMGPVELWDGDGVPPPRVLAVIKDEDYFNRGSLCAGFFVKMSEGKRNRAVDKIVHIKLINYGILSLQFRVPSVPYLQCVKVCFWHRINL